MKKFIKGFATKCKQANKCFNFGFAVFTLWKSNHAAALVIFYIAAKNIFTLLLNSKSSKAKQIWKVNTSRISSLHLILCCWSRSTVKMVTKLNFPWFVWLWKGKAIKVPLDLYLTCSFKYLLEHAHFWTLLTGFLRGETANLAKSQSGIRKLSQLKPVLFAFIQGLSSLWEHNHQLGMKLDRLNPSSHFKGIKKTKACDYTNTANTLLWDTEQPEWDELPPQKQETEGENWWGEWWQCKL